MGKDIHLHIVKNGEIIKEDIYHGRNSQWFDEMTDRFIDGYDSGYPCECGLPKHIQQIYDQTKLKECGYFDFRFVKVRDYINWFESYRPDIDAGWVNTYIKWKYENKNEVPDPDDIHRFLTDKDIIEDMHFIEIKNPYNNFLWLYDYLINKNISKEADIIYWFDC